MWGGEERREVLSGGGWVGEWSEVVEGEVGLVEEFEVGGWRGACEHADGVVRVGGVHYYVYLGGVHGGHHDGGAGGAVVVGLCVEGFKREADWRGGMSVGQGRRLGWGNVLQSLTPLEVMELHTV